MNSVFQDFEQIPNDTLPGLSFLICRTRQSTSASLEIFDGITVSLPQYAFLHSNRGIICGESDVACASEFAGYH